MLERPASVGGDRHPMFQLKALGVKSSLSSSMSTLSRERSESLLIACLMSSQPMGVLGVFGLMLMLIKVSFSVMDGSMRLRTGVSIRRVVENDLSETELTAGELINLFRMDDK